MEILATIPAPKYTTDSYEIVSEIQWHNKTGSPLVIDLETTGLETHKAELLDIVISTRYGSALMFPGSMKELLKEIYCPLVGHNIIRYDLAVLYYNGIDLRENVVYDTMLLHHIDDENKSHKLDDIVQERYGDNYKEVFWSKNENYEDATEADKVDYACKDVIYTLHLFRDIDLDRTDLSKHIHHFAMELLNTELQGIQVDTAYLHSLGEELKSKEIAILEAAQKSASRACRIVELNMYAKELDKRKTTKGKALVQMPKFNWASSTQVKELLYGQLNLPLQKNIKTKNITVDDAALHNLQGKHAVVDSLLELRKVQKMQSAFIEGITERIRDGRVHPHFNVNGTVTGRISCSSPNLQQMPAKGEWAKIRGVFIPAQGYKFISCDYSQLEICIAAHYSGDPVLIDLVKRGESMHDRTAAACGIDREQAKKMNFTVLYGGGAYKVSHDMGCSVEQAEEYLERLLNEYKGLKKIIDECHDKVEQGEPIVSVFGRARNFPITFETPQEKKRAKRQAFNALIQGTGADLTHQAFRMVGMFLREWKWGRVCYPIHDEILIEVKEEYCNQAKELLVCNMLASGIERKLLVPLTVDCSELLDRWEK